MNFYNSLHEVRSPKILKRDGLRFLKQVVGFQFWINLCCKMLKNGLNWDFLENGPKDFDDIGNLNEVNYALPKASGPVF